MRIYLYIRTESIQYLLLSYRYLYVKLKYIIYVFLIIWNFLEYFISKKKIPGTKVHKILLVVSLHFSDAFYSCTSQVADRELHYGQARLPGRPTHFITDGTLFI